MVQSCDDNGICEPIDGGLFGCDDNGVCFTDTGAGTCPLGQLADDNGLCSDPSTTWGNPVGTAGGSVVTSGGGAWASVGAFLGKLFGGVAGQVGGVRVQTGTKSCQGYDPSGRAVTVRVSAQSACPSGTALQRVGRQPQPGNSLLLFGLGAVVVVLLVRK